MKTLEAPNIRDNIAQFEELCSSFSDLSQRLMTGTGHTNAAEGVNLADVCISGLRADLGIPKYIFPGKYRNPGISTNYGIPANLVFNDYFAVTEIVKLKGDGHVSLHSNDKGRITYLLLGDYTSKLCEVTLLSELEELSILKYSDADLSPLVDCLKLTRLTLHVVETQMEKLVSVLERMPWLKTINVFGKRSMSDSEPMNLAWATNHRELTKLCGDRLGIKDLTPLSSCINLESLHIGGNPIHSLAPLQALTRLMVLDIRGTRISDLSSLCDLNSLVELRISRRMTKLPGYIKCKEMILARGGQLEVDGSVITDS